MRTKSENPENNGSFVELLALVSKNNIYSAYNAQQLTSNFEVGYTVTCCLHNIDIAPNQLSPNPEVKR